jgi:hypothetical protein
MKLKYAFIALAALGGAALSGGTASAMQVAPLGQSHASSIESVALVCGVRGCVRTVPAWRRRVVVAPRVLVAPRPYVRRGYYRRGYRVY